MRSRSRLFYLLLVSALLGLLAVSCASPAPSNPDYKFREGDVATYKFETSQKGKVTIDGSTEEFDLYMANTISQKVQKVDEQGIATIDANYEDSRLIIDGDDLPIPDLINASITYEIDGDGAISNVRGTNGLAGPLGERQFDPGQIFQFQGPMFREGNLNKGDKWQKTIAIPMPGADQIEATIDYTYEGKERVNGKDAAKIHFVFDAPMDMMYIDMDSPVKVVGREQMEGTAFFLVDDGRTLKASGSGPLTISLSMPSEGGGEDLERVKVEIDVSFNHALQD